jgi:hypothetical protein
LVLGEKPADGSLPFVVLRWLVLGFCKEWRCYIDAVAQVQCYLRGMNGLLFQNLTFVKWAVGRVDLIAPKRNKMDQNEPKRNKTGKTGQASDRAKGCAAAVLGE